MPVYTAETAVGSGAELSFSILCRGRGSAAKRRRQTQIRACVSGKGQACWKSGNLILLTVFWVLTRFYSLCFRGSLEKQNLHTTYNDKTGFINCPHQLLDSSTMTTCKLESCRNLRMFNPRGCKPQNKRRRQSQPKDEG